MSNNPNNPVHEQWFTSAPDAYDYTAWTKEIKKAEWSAYDGATPTKGRIVCIPEDRAKYQTERYMSGMYATVKMTTVHHDHEHNEVEPA